MNFIQATCALILCVAQFSLARTPGVTDIMNQLNETQWNGNAGLLQIDGKVIGNSAHMAFQVHDGHLYYLSNINRPLDKKIDERAHGLCQNSPPREAVLFPSEDGLSIDGRVVLPDFNMETKAHSYYSIPIENLKLENSVLTFTSIPKKIKNTDINIRYLLRPTKTQTSQELADRLKRCLQTKPWVR